MVKNDSFNGLGLGLGNLARLSHAQTRSISAENFSGEKGRGGMATEGTGAFHARELGQGWKISPSVVVAPSSTFSLAEIQQSGAIQHLWITTFPANWRRLILRAYWDDEREPSIECPLGDFFVNGWCERCNVNSLPVAVNPAGGMNAYWQMPFRQGARLTLENLGHEEAVVYYQIDYTLTEVPDDMAYFHAQWRRRIPCPTRRCIRCLTMCMVRGIMWAPILPGRATTRVGGARARSNFTWTVIRSFQRSVVLEPKIISAVPGASRIPEGNTACIPRLFSACPRSSSQMGCTVASSALGCIAGTSWIRSVSSGICAWSSRRWVGAVEGAIFLSRMILPRLPSGISVSRTRRILSYQELMGWK